MKKLNITYSEYKLLREGQKQSIYNAQHGDRWNIEKLLFRYYNATEGPFVILDYRIRKLKEVFIEEIKNIKLWRRG